MVWVSLGACLPSYRRLHNSPADQNDPFVLPLINKPLARWVHGEPTFPQQGTIEFDIYFDGDNNTHSFLDSYANSISYVMSVDVLQSDWPSVKHTIDNTNQRIITRLLIDNTNQRFVLFMSTQKLN